MAFMNDWLYAAIALMPPLAAAVCIVSFGGSAGRLAALPFAGTLIVLLMMLLSMAVGQSSFFDLALAAAFIGIPGLLLYAHFLEQWL
jgi:multisubunit Na+/H+ antiporter MnhF subunit